MSKDASPHIPARRLALLTGMLFALAFNILLGAWLIGLYQSMLERGRATAEGLIAVFRTHTERILGEIDRTALEFRNFPVKLDPSELERIMLYKREQQPAILNIFRLNARGEITTWTGGDWRPEVSDRPYFTKHRDNPELERFVDGPLRSRLSPTKWFLSLSHGVKTPRGAFDGSIVVTIDLVNLAQEYQAILDTPGASVVMTDLKGRVLMRQPEVEGAVGTILPSFQGRENGYPELTHWTALSPIDRQERLIAFRNLPGYPLSIGVTLLKSKVLSGWYTYLALALFLSLAVTSATFLASRRIAGSLARREHAIRRLRESRAIVTAQLQYQQTLLNAIPVPIATSDTNGVFIQCNNAFLRWTGHSVTEVLGRTCQDILPANVVEKYRQSFEDLLDAGGQIQFETAWADRHGTERRAVVYRTAHQGIERLGSAVISIVIDVTSQKQIEDELKRSNAELEQFSYAISHDLQEPLRMVSSYLALVERRYKQVLDKDGLEFIDFAVDGAKRMSGMIQGLLEYSRVNRKGQSFRPVDLAQAAQDAMVNLALAISESAGTVDVQSLPTVNGDPGQLMRLMQNLIGNALKYRKPDEPPKVTISSARQDDHWTITVADNGIGIAPENTDRLFKVFQRLHSRTQYEGFGIGLAVCRRIVERHGGRIWVESETGQGSRFIFTLPALPKAADA
ncbi:MAG: PAS domain S-box protein [Alphaproteobacteria bacterium]|nr:PAS domain S-box protein [Alphaproteobacteria bacterium]